MCHSLFSITFHLRKEVLLIHTSCPSSVLLYIVSRVIQMIHHCLLNLRWIWRHLGLLLITDLVTRFTYDQSLRRLQVLELLLDRYVTLHC